MEIPKRHPGTPVLDYDTYSRRVGDLAAGTKEPGHRWTSYVQVIEAEYELAVDPRTAPKVLKFAAVHDGWYMGGFVSLEGERAAGL